MFLSMQKSGRKTNVIKEVYDNKTNMGDLVLRKSSHFMPGVRNHSQFFILSRLDSRTEIYESYRGTICL